MTERWYGTAIVKAAVILDYLGQQEFGKGVTEIARHTGLNKATVFKLLATLCHIGYVEKHTSEAVYTLGIGAVQLARSALRQMDWIELVRPLLAQINQETGETVHLGVVDRDRIVYVAKLESRQAVRMYSSVGKSAPMYCTGIGKALLSTYDEMAFHRYLSQVQLTPYTTRTVRSVTSLATDIERTRQRGYAVDDGEHEEDVRCVAVPVVAGGVRCAMSVSAPSYRMDDEAVQRYARLLVSYARAAAETMDHWAAT